VRLRVGSLGSGVRMVAALGAGEEERECFSITALGGGWRKKEERDFEFLLLGAAAWLERAQGFGGRARVTWVAVLGNTYIGQTNNHRIFEVTAGIDHEITSTGLPIPSCSLMLPKLPRVANMVG